MDIAIHRLGLPHDFRAHGMLAEKCFQAFRERTTFRPLHASLIEDHANTDIAALERNAPTPPSIAHEMIGGRGADAMTCQRPVGKFLCELMAIPVPDVAPARPYTGGGVF